jgi:hypothetical protein
MYKARLTISEARAEPKSPGFAAVMSQSLRSGIVVQYLYYLHSSLISRKLLLHNSKLLLTVWLTGAAEKR